MARRDLERDLSELARRARVDHPLIAVDDATFTRYVATRLDGASPESLVTSDLYLVCGCLAGDRNALVTFDREILGDVRAALATSSSAATIDELVQQARCRLIVGDEGRPPLLAKYGGKGKLRRWVRSVVVRMMLSEARSRHREVSLDDVFLRDAEAASNDVVADYVRHRYRAQLQSIIADALRALSARQRNALRLHLIDGVTLDQLAALHGVHRATAARWLAQSRDSLRAQILRRIETELGIGEADAESLLGSLLSRLEVDLEGYSAP